MNRKVGVILIVVIWAHLFYVFFVGKVHRYMERYHFNRSYMPTKDSGSLDAVKVLSLSDFPIMLERDDKYNFSFSGQTDKKTFMKFAPALNSTEYGWYLQIISEFNQRCKALNVAYMLAGGSVLGAYRYHGFIPWDDDFDVLVNSTQKESLMKALQSVHGYNLHITDNFPWKFYSENMSVGTRMKWKWPFIDVFFFEENQTHIYDVTVPKIKKDVYLRSEIIPLQYEVFENIILPVPYDMDSYLNKRYSMEDPCKTHSWIHKQEKATKPVHIPCYKLSSVYATVNRFKAGGISYEELRLGNKTLYRLRRS